MPPWHPAAMTPGARISAAIEVLDRILGGQPAEQALLRWSRASRFAGSGDRAAVRDLVFDALRRRDSLAALGGAGHGRGLMIGHLREAGQDPAALFTGAGHAPAPLSDAERSSVADRAGILDLPEWLLPRWRADLGDQAEAVAHAMGRRAPVWLRVNPLRARPDQAVAALAADGVATRPDPRLPTALCVTAGERRIQQGRAYREGLVELQDLSPQLACARLPLSEGLLVLDYCAGGGGKTLALAGQQPELRLVAHDADPARMRDLPARAARAGVQVVLTDDPRGAFGLVVADVPCSGSGTWRRHPDAKWRLTPQALAGLCTAQAAILERAARLVAPRGYLAYMTCSLLREENDRQIGAFVRKHDHFQRIVQETWTPVEAGDGFFLALMARVG